VSLVAGFDISTKRLDMVLVPLDPENDTLPSWRTEVRPKGDTDATAWAASATAELLRLWPDSSFAVDVAMIGVERPAGRVHPHLAWVFGAVYGQCSRLAPTSGWYPASWRAELGIKNTKAAVEAWGMDPDLWYERDHRWFASLDEHGRDAFALARAVRDFFWREAR
jgi:hypothetical protein